MVRYTRDPDTQGLNSLLRVVHGNLRYHVSVSSRPRCILPPPPLFPPHVCLGSHQMTCHAPEDGLRGKVRMSLLFCMRRTMTYCTTPSPPRLVMITVSHCLSILFLRNEEEEELCISIPRTLQKTIELVLVPLDRDDTGSVCLLALSARPYVKITCESVSTTFAPTLRATARICYLRLFSTQDEQAFGEGKTIRR